VKSTTVRIGKGPKDVARGYKGDDLADLWDRYLPPLAAEQTDPDGKKERGVESKYEAGGAAEEDVAEGGNEVESSSCHPDPPKTATSATSATSTAGSPVRSMSFDGMTGGMLIDDDDDDY
jgi:hypothetical protein